jgi:hypothetical protein
VERQLRQVEQQESNININMILREFFQNEPTAYHDLNNDNSRPMLGKLRKTRLTLKQLNKIRRMNDLRKYEYEQKLKDIRVQYAPPAQPTI